MNTHAAPTSAVEALDQDIWRIDTAYQRAGLAACYLIRGGDDFALIECGSGVSVAPILRALEQLNVAPEAVRYLIPTHVHLDHAGGTGGLMRALPRAELHVHPRGLAHLVDPARLLAGAMAVYGEAEFRRANGEILAAPAERSFAAEDGSSLMLGDRLLEMRDAPGHANHHLVVWDVRSRGFFTGDVFGLAYPELNTPQGPFIAPTTTPVQFDPEAWLKTLRMMAGYEPSWAYLTHYGRIAMTPARFSELRQRVLAHAEMAQTHVEVDEANLARLLGEALFADYQAAGGGVSRDTFDSILNMDLNLNAQGLKVWLARQRKAQA